MKLYIVTRKDLPPGLMLAQACHALRGFVEAHPEEDQKWFRESNNIVCLEIENESALLNLVKKAVCADIPHAVFREPDRDGEATSVAFGAGARRLVSGLPLALKAVQEKPLQIAAA